MEATACECSASAVTSPSELQLMMALIIVIMKFKPGVRFVRMYLAGSEILGAESQGSRPLQFGMGTGVQDMWQDPKSPRGPGSLLHSCVHFTSRLWFSVVKNVSLLPTSFCHNQFQLFLSQTSAKKKLL